MLGLIQFRPLVLQDMLEFAGENFSRVENIFIDQREFNAPPRVKQNIC